MLPFLARRLHFEGYSWFEFEAQHRKHLVSVNTSSCPFGQTQVAEKEYVSLRTPADFEVDPDEANLIAACRRQEPLAQAELYETYSQNVSNLLCRMVGRDYAEDLTQQVFLKLLKSLDRFAGRSKFSTWLYRVATNEALQFLRTERSRNDFPLLDNPMDQRASSLKQIDDREWLEQALTQLDPDLRAVFLLREVESLSYHQLALSLDIAEGTVASRLNRARRMLQESLTTSNPNDVNNHDW